MKILLLVIPACMLIITECRRIEIRPRLAETQLYYDEEDSPADVDDYGSQPVYQPRTRALPSPRSKDTLHGSKQPPVQTIRNYNKVNDDGSFTFGYEAADGSFKEETRGTDCVVRGKYGYVDPDGNKREFTYVSGNPCDPNAPKDDDEELNKKNQQDEDDTSGPANYPSVRPVARPARPSYSTTPRAPVTVFQNEYQLDDEASQELEEDTKPQQPLRPSAFRRPTYVHVAAEPSSPLYRPTSTPSQNLYRLASTTASPRYQSQSTAATPKSASYSATYYQPIESSTRGSASTKPRPASIPHAIAITPRPNSVTQIAAQYYSPSSTERPGVVYAPRTVTPVHAATTATPPSQHLDFVAELERYVNSVGGSTPRPQVVQAKATSQPIQASRPDPIYQSELIYDPSTGQYNTQLYQSLPQTLGDFSLSHKLQPYVAASQQHQHQPLLSLQQSPIYRAGGSSQPGIASQQKQQQQQKQPQEAIYKKQQAQLLQQSQQLYAQQQRRQQQPNTPTQVSIPTAQRVQLLDSQREPQRFYYIATAAQDGTPTAHGPISVGQIDQFLRNSANSF